MKINIVGWSGVNHSYSFVAESYVKGLLRDDVIVYFTPHKLYYESSKIMQTIFDEMTTPKERTDITIRFVYPYDLTPDANSDITIVFMTCEFSCLTEFVDTKDIPSNVYVLTPSEYSKRGLITSGIPGDKIIVVSHCYDAPEVDTTKEELRRKYNIPLDYFVYFHNSAITTNKRVDYLVRAFEKIYEKNPKTILLIKGVDSVYRSMDKLNEIIQLINLEKEMKCLKNIIYEGKDLSRSAMIELYKMSDCYVAPYIAEGFNLPVLEALCNGINVICTKDGPTDEYARDAYFIDNTVERTSGIFISNNKILSREYHNPDFACLYQKMELVLTQRNRIDEIYYKNKYSVMEIGNILFGAISNMIKTRIETPKIIVINGTNDTLENIRGYSGNTNIYNVYDKTQKVKNDDPLNYCVGMAEIVDSRKDIEIKKVIEYMMRILSTKKIIYIANGYIPIMHPITLYEDIMKRYGSKVVCINVSGVIACVCVDMEQKSDIIKNIDEPKYELKDIMGKTGIKTFKNNNKYYFYDMKGDEWMKIGIIKAEEGISSCMERYKKMHQKYDIREFISQSEVGIITTDVIEKYKDIMRCVPLTILFDKKNMNVNSDTNMNKNKILVYPEVLEYFFDVIYKVLEHKFILITFEDESEIIFKKDTKKIITSNIFYANISQQKQQNDK